ncbi:MAG: hypothetical protein ABG776_04470, partial [Cyanobacteria bacterium J06555_13]
MNRPTRESRAGFVLPTTVLLLLMVTLTVGAMSYRTFSRTAQTIAYRDQQVIDSLSAPAIDRAKAKIEFLFTKDGSVADKRPPSSADLLAALAPASGGDDPYTIPGLEDDGGETRLDLDSTDDRDNAWRFRAPDGTTIVYSIVIDDTHDNGTNVIGIDGVDDTGKVDDQQKADNFVVRNGPIDTTTPTDSCPVARLAGNGWQISGARLAKNIQVNVLAIKGSGPNKTVSASEYQQVRTAARGNRWGAWFRYDLEVSPGSPMRWNGAMHTEGSLVTGKGFTAYMVSSQESCIYDEDASVIEVSGPVDNDKDGTDDFLGQVVSGLTGKRAGEGAFLSESSTFHSDATAKDLDASGGGKLYADGVQKLGATATPQDSVVHQAATTNPSDITQNPISIFTEDTFVYMKAPVEAPSTTSWRRRDNWETVGPSRIKNDDTGAARPFLDDSYRADNRYGPKPKYNDKHSLSLKNGDPLTTPHKSGDVISDNTALTLDVPNSEDYGLDGYWERSAAAQGLRLIVGQRLELGNPFGWKSDDPLYPANNAFVEARSPVGQLKGTAEMLQMRSLRDNLAAVQSMAVYHSADATTLGEYPLACIASTVHPGTSETLENSRTFVKENSVWKTDFFTGQGTNGMEFTPPPASEFGSTLDSKWVKALGNLAYFAGDPKGGAPSFPAVQEKESTANNVV